MASVNLPVDLGLQVRNENHTLSAGQGADVQTYNADPGYAILSAHVNVEDPFEHPTPVQVQGVAISSGGGQWSVTTTVYYAGDHAPSYSVNIVVVKA